MWRGCSTALPPSPLPPSYPIHPHQSASQPLSPDPLAHFAARVPSLSFSFSFIYLSLSIRNSSSADCPKSGLVVVVDIREAPRIPHILRRVSLSPGLVAASQALSLPQDCVAALRFRTSLPPGPCCTPLVLQVKVKRLRPSAKAQQTRRVASVCVALPSAVAALLHRDRMDCLAAPLDVCHPPDEITSYFFYLCLSIGSNGFKSGFMCSLCLQPVGSVWWWHCGGGYHRRAGRIALTLTMTC